MAYDVFYENDKGVYGNCPYRWFTKIGSKRCAVCKHNKGHNFLNGWIHYCICSYLNDKQGGE